MISMRVALMDLVNSLRAWRLFTLLGWVEIRQRYARSKLGPFWLTISMGALIGAIGVVFGALLGQDMATYLPMLSIGIVAWTLLSSIITEGCNAYISSAAYIRQVNTPRFVYILQVAWRNTIIFAHNFLIVIVVLAIYGVRDWTVLPLMVPGIVILLLNAVWMAMIVGLLSARFRDLPQIVNSVMVMMFYVTPIMFGSHSLTKHKWVVDINPFAYLINIVRAPLMGQMPSERTWVVAIAMTFVGLVAGLALTGRYHKRIPYWL